MDDETVTEHKEVGENEGGNGHPPKGETDNPEQATACNDSGNVIVDSNVMAAIKEIYTKESDNGNSNPTKLNCWEYKNCGREAGGVNAEKYGICPVTTAVAYDNLHGGTNAGRSCWAVPCATSEHKGSFASKLKNCTTCEFHRLVIQEENKYQSAVNYLKKARKEEKSRTFREPGFIKHIYEKSKHQAFEDSFEVESFFITLLIGWVSLCPSVSMLEGSKRLCKEDLVDELMVIDAIADNPRRRAAKTVAKTMFKALRRQMDGYFDPLLKKTNIRKPYKKKTH